MSENELKPCPFCGSENMRTGNEKYITGKDIYIECTKCSARIQICAEYGEEELVKMWNNRV